MIQKFHEPVPFEDEIYDSKTESYEKVTGYILGIDDKYRVLKLNESSCQNDVKITNEDIDLFKSMLINWESIEDDLKKVIKLILKRFYH